MLGDIKNMSSILDMDTRKMLENVKKKNKIYHESIKKETET
jgi:hypothetical protein